MHRVTKLRWEFHTAVLGNTECWQRAAQLALTAPSIHFRRKELLHHGTATWPSRSSSPRRRCFRAASRWRDQRDFCNNNIHTFTHWHIRCRLLVPSSRRVGGEQNMMPYVSVFCKPRCCVDVQTGPVNYVLCPAPSLPSSWSAATDASLYNVFLQTARLPRDMFIHRESRKRSRPILRHNFEKM